MKDRDEFLENEFDFSKAIKNPYTKASKKQITINLDEEVILFFKNKAENTGIPYQTLINLYLKDCVKNNRQLELSWKQRACKNQNYQSTLLFSSTSSEL